MTEHVAVDEEYLLVEEVADRLGLPLAVLMRRVEAGDIPAQRIENENGVHYILKLSDLGIEDAAPEAGSDEGAGPYGAEMPHDEHEVATVDLTGRRVAEDEEDHREPAQPSPPWLHDEATLSAAHDADVETDEAPHAAAEHAGVGDELEQLAVEDVPLGTEASLDDVEVLDRDHVGPADARSLDEAAPRVAAPVPAALIAEQRSPHGDLSAMSLDARELVAGLLDRWERTLEQRIYTEQRQRFQGELTARQNMVKQLQMELHTVRAEHAAAQAQKDRQLAEKERELADRERDLADARRLAEETERLLAPAASARRRRWFWQRDD